MLSLSLPPCRRLCGPGAESSRHGAADRDSPVALYPGLGSWTHPIGVRNPEAQKFFDQGQALLYGFNRHEALRSFRKVLELEPTSAMAQWGISMSLGPYLNMDMDSGVHIKEACGRCRQSGHRLWPPAHSSPQRVWLEAAAARCPDFSRAREVRRCDESSSPPASPTTPTRRRGARRSPQLLPVRWRWYDAEGKPAPGVTEAEHVLEAVLRRFPNHPGANHFYIHAVESSPNPERAVPSAQRLMGIVPAAGHMVHMLPGHIWLVLGEFNTTVDAITSAPPR